MSDAKTITVWVDYDNPQKDGTRDVGSEAFWAVKIPSDKSGYIDKDGAYKDYSFAPSEAWRILGSFDVVVYDKQTIQGLRLLLNAIEEDLDA